MLRALLVPGNALAFVVTLGVLGVLVLGGCATTAPLDGDERVVERFTTRGGAVEVDLDCAAALCTEIQVIAVQGPLGAATTSVGLTLSNIGEAPRALVVSGHVKDASGRSTAVGPTVVTVDPGDRGEVALPTPHGTSGPLQLSVRART
jgi:hypothetical protein